MYLIEIYKSVQGESSHAGRPCIFVRLAGCNLRCSWCDSEYTFNGGHKLSEEQILTEIEKLAPVRLIEFTGGEPLLQERELVPLMQRLLVLGYELMMETSGERPLDRVPPAVHKIVDVKCPASGESGSFRASNLEFLTQRDEVKFVIANREDYEFARDFIRRHALEARVGSVLLSPAFHKLPSTARSTENCLLDPRELVEWMLADGLEARLSLQIHKFIWEPQKKGV
ncbi:radical SAM protein [Pseudacidobacterium ailaaui]|uniref:radical SAM protein n=1 Tax=Pseudacidobacterium ailaaui TaxID=1382359 RepID=UPI00047EBC06|nr:radical SAM protein [Pseudacidobacterium ailaaui]MBX6358968.1 radical SAM protein [Pseudacidobacterium ailaaui]MDI3253805.1 radical SAM protein [Bacillota bacterium]